MHSYPDGIFFSPLSPSVSLPFLAILDFPGGPRFPYTFQAALPLARSIAKGLCETQGTVQDKEKKAAINTGLRN